MLNWDFFIFIPMNYVRDCKANAVGTASLTLTRFSPFPEISQNGLFQCFTTCRREKFRKSFLRT